MVGVAELTGQGVPPSTPTAGSEAWGEEEGLFLGAHRNKEQRFVEAGAVIRTVL